MKNILLGSIVLFIALLAPLSVSAHWHAQRYAGPSSPRITHAQPTPPVATTTQLVSPGTGSTTSPVATGQSNGIQNQVCVNYGYSAINGSYNLTKAAADFATLKGLGINCVRLAFYGTNSGVTKPLALAAKAAGFYVSVGNDGSPTDSGYATGVIAFAQWAQANHIDQVSIGNEDAKNSSTQGILSSLSCQVRQVYSGTISYDTYENDPTTISKGGFDDIKAWAQNKGCLTKLGLNMYANYSATAAEAQADLGANGWYVSEFGVDMDTGNYGTDALRAAGTQTAINALKSYNVPEYFFAWDAGGDNVKSYWALANSPQTLKVITGK